MHGHPYKEGISSISYFKIPDEVIIISEANYLYLTFASRRYNHNTVYVVSKYKIINIWYNYADYMYALIIIIFITWHIEYRSIRHTGIQGVQLTG